MQWRPAACATVNTWWSSSQRYAILYSTCTNHRRTFLRHLPSFSSPNLTVTNNEHMVTSYWLMMNWGYRHYSMCKMKNENKMKTTRALGRAHTSDRAKQFSIGRRQEKEKEGEETEWQGKNRRTGEARGEEQVLGMVWYSRV